MPNPKVRPVPPEIIAAPKKPTPPAPVDRPEPIPETEPPADSRYSTLSSFAALLDVSCVVVMIVGCIGAFVGIAAADMLGNAGLPLVMGSMIGGLCFAVWFKLSAESIRLALAVAADIEAIRRGIEKSPFDRPGTGKS